MNLIGKVAIVTGGGRGIGAGIARRLLEQKIRVVVAEIDASFTDYFSEASSDLLFIETDVKDERSVENMILKSVEKFGQVDALINNAGILFDNVRPSFEQITLKEWRQTIDTNLTGAFLCSKYAASQLRKQKGCIVNIGSTRAFQSEPNTEPYSASKGGIYALTHAMAMSLAPDIRVNCVSPGWIDTGKDELREIDHKAHPVGRVGKVEDIAAMVAFLISEDASFITAQNFIVDGGMTKKMIYPE